MKPTTAMSWSRQASTIFSGSPFFCARFALCSRCAWVGAKRRRKKSSRVGFSGMGGRRGASPIWRCSISSARSDSEGAVLIGPFPWKCAGPARGQAKVGVGLRQSAEHARQDHFTLRIDLGNCRLLRKLAPTFSVIPAKAGMMPSTAPWLRQLPSFPRKRE